MPPSERSEQYVPYPCQGSLSHYQDSSGGSVTRCPAQPATRHMFSLSISGNFRLMMMMVLQPRNIPLQLVALHSLIEKLRTVSRTFPQQRLICWVRVGVLQGRIILILTDWSSGLNTGHTVSKTVEW